MERRKVSRVLLWIGSILVAFVFVMVGKGKVTNPFWLKAFSRWGYSDGFRLLIGVLEMVGGLLLAFSENRPVRRHSDRHHHVRRLRHAGPVP